MPRFHLDKFAKAWGEKDKFSGEGADVSGRFMLFIEMFTLVCTMFDGMHDIAVLDFLDPLAAIPAGVEAAADMNVYIALVFLTTGSARNYVRNSVIKNAAGNNVYSGLRALAKLKGLYGSRTMGHVTSVQDNISQHMFPESRDPSRSISTLTDLFNEMDMLDAGLSEYAKITYIVKALPASYHSLRTALSMRTDMTTLSAATIFDMVQTHWNDIVRVRNNRSSTNYTLGENHGESANGMVSAMMAAAMSYSQGGKGKGGKGKGKGKGKGSTGRGRGNGNNNRNSNGLGVRNTWNKYNRPAAAGGNARPSSNQSADVDLSNVQCYKCKRDGHYASDCRTKACPVCGSFEHSPWDCPNSQFSAQGHKQRRQGSRGNGNSVTWADDIETPGNTTDAEAHAITSVYCQPVHEEHDDELETELENIRRQISEMDTSDSDEEFDSADDNMDDDDDSDIHTM